MNNVVVLNVGIDWSEVLNVYWSNFIMCCECCFIVVEGNGEFDVKDVVFEGDVCYVVLIGK